MQAHVCASMCGNNTYLPVVHHHVVDDVRHLPGHLQQQWQQGGHDLEQHLAQQWQLQTETTTTTIFS